MSTPPSTVSNSWPDTGVCEQLQKFRASTKARVERILAQAAAAHIRPTIGQTFPLEQAAAAHAAIEAREVLGKTLLVM